MGRGYTRIAIAAKGPAMAHNPADGARPDRAKAHVGVPLIMATAHTKMFPSSLGSPD
jgi:hypothetical protein